MYIFLVVPATKCDYIDRGKLCRLRIQNIRHTPDDAEYQRQRKCQIIIVRVVRAIEVVR